MVITIGRQHGSNGHLIARALAERLGYACYDKEIVDRAAEDSPFSKEVVDSFDEKRVSPYFAPNPHILGGGEGFQLNMQVAAAQFDAIRKLAEGGNCIFVGRCADYILRNRPDLLRVFILADMDLRVKTMMERRGMTEERARKLVRQVDKDRSSYYKYYTDQVWGDAANFDLCVNAGKLGVENTARLIAELVLNIEPAGIPEHPPELLPIKEET